MDAMKAAPGQRSVLVVDDDVMGREISVKYLSRSGFHVGEAESGKQALERMDQARYDLMLLDVRMPGMDGPAVLPLALKKDPEIGVMMLSGIDDASTAARCMQLGALDYLTKPMELAALAAAVTRGIKTRDSLVQDRSKNSKLQAEAEKSGEDAERSRHMLQQVTMATLEVLINALETKDPYLVGHSHRIAALGAMIADEMGLSENDVEQVRIAGRLHDIGKIALRDDILTKGTSMSEADREQVKQHVRIGAQILAPLVHLGPVVDYVRTHHEQWNGEGYLEGLKGTAIPIGGRILCAAEIYDSLTADRPLQPGLLPREAAKRMRELSGTVLDPDVVTAINSSVSRRSTLVFVDDVDAGLNVTGITMLK